MSTIKKNSSDKESQKIISVDSRETITSQSENISEVIVNMSDKKVGNKAVTTNSDLSADLEDQQKNSSTKPTVIELYSSPCYMSDLDEEY
tara:strand:+ start:1883 stop:2152 length:270 start_codon:yes stop_codon:yes gene_type:complete